MTYRIWWLIAFFALGIGIAIEMEMEAASGVEAGPPAAEARAPVSAEPNAGGLPAAPAQARLKPFARHGAG